MHSIAYPHSNALSEELSQFVTDRCVSMTALINTAIEIVAEYEHGTAEIELFGLTSIEQYKDILLDYLVYILTMEEMNDKTNHCGCHG